MKSNPATHVVELSALLVDLADGAPTEIKLVPFGQFRSARDSRPVGVPAWVMNAENAQAILSAQSQLKSQFLVDYDHQTLRADKNGQPAPAAGWGGALEWREGDGLYATKMDWTPAALNAINAKEYRYISPVIKFDPKTGDVTGVPMAALVNFPALDGLNDLAAAAAQLFTNPTQETNMEEILERLRYLLNLPLTSTPEDISAELDKLKVMITGSAGTTEGLAALLTAKADEIAALSAQITDQVDPTQYAPIAVVTELRSQLSVLSGNTLELQVEKLIKSGTDSGKLIGDFEKSWAAEMGKKDIAALQAYLDGAQPIAALSGMQSKGIAPDMTQTAALSATAEEIAVAEQLGVSIDDIIKQRSK